MLSAGAALGLKTLHVSPCPRESDTYWLCSILGQLLLGHRAACLYDAPHMDTQKSCVAARPHGLHPRLSGGTADPRPFSPSFPLQVDQRVFRDLMSEKLPRLHTHFEQYKVDYTLITFNWFLVVFVDSVVSDILFKIWDSFLYEGPKVSGLCRDTSLSDCDRLCR